MAGTMPAHGRAMEEGRVLNKQCEQAHGGRGRALEDFLCGQAHGVRGRALEDTWQACVAHKAACSGYLVRSTRGKQVVEACTHTCTITLESVDALNAQEEHYVGVEQDK
eukprot:366577-Chlamydomonas_euryale.AAC.7